MYVSFVFFFSLTKKLPRYLDDRLLGNNSTTPPPQSPITPYRTAAHTTCVCRCRTLVNRQDTHTAFSSALLSRLPPPIHSDAVHLQPQPQSRTGGALGRRRDRRSGGTGYGRQGRGRATDVPGPAAEAVLHGRGRGARAGPPRKSNPRVLAGNRCGFLFFSGRREKKELRAHRPGPADHRNRPFISWFVLFSLRQEEPAVENVCVSRK